LIRADPNAGVLAPSFGADVETSAGVDDGALEGAHERYDFSKTLQPADGIDYDLAGAVVRDVAAALDVCDVDASARDFLAIQQNVLALSLPSERYHRRMFDDDPRIGTAPVADIGVRTALQFECFAVTTGSDVD
jgi:hypothetical protein